MAYRTVSAPTTIRDIARALGVSHTTVSRVLNGRGESFISEGTRERILTAAREMNYQPNRVARKLATGRTDAIALWLTGTHAYVNTALTEVERILRENGRDMLHIVSQKSIHTSDLNLFADGILALDRVDDVAAYVRQGGGRPPIVNMGCYVCRDVDFVTVDLKRGATLAVAHLLDTGCRRIAMFLPAHQDPVNVERAVAYEAVLKEAGQPPEYIPCPVNGRASARAAIRDYVVEKGCPDGIFCYNDELAIGAYRGLRDRGVRIPDDVALVGFDGIEDTEYLDVPLSTVVLPYAGFCERAWGLLERRLAQPDAPVESEILPMTLAVRESSRRS